MTEKTKAKLRDSFPKQKDITQAAKEASMIRSQNEYAKYNSVYDNFHTGFMQGVKYVQTYLANQQSNP